MIELISKNDKIYWLFLKNYNNYTYATTFISLTMAYLLINFHFFITIKYVNVTVIGRNHILSVEIRVLEKLNKSIKFKLVII